MRSSASKVIKLHPDDNVAVALEKLNPGDVVTVGELSIPIKEEINTGHKVALVSIEQGSNVIKYGYPIGHAVQSIEPGAWVHSHNLETNLEGLLEYTYEPNIDEAWKDACDTNICSKTFQGYVREDGQVGVRNEIWIINTVGCVNKTAEKLAKEANKLFADRNIDGVYHFAHPYGCSQLGDDHLYTQKILADLVHHPNAGAVLVLGLGCENNNIPEFQKVIGDWNPQRVKFMNTQDVEDEIEEGLAILAQLVEYAEQFEREPVPVSKLVVGLKCGGSDGFSGITANPLVGAFSDMLTACGGTTLLTEVPEMFGAETILMNRCISKEVFDKCVNMINGFKEYYIRHGQVIYENPSPGNKEGGITTLEDKSLGCTQKGGTSPVVDVLDYGERVKEKGLNLLKGPGNDIVAVTALAASGAQLVLFTTGRGTPLGGPVPTVKISTNTALAVKKKNWIDFNAGQLVEGKTMEDLKVEFFNYVIDVASGKERTKNELNDFREIAIFKDGVIL